MKCRLDKLVFNQGKFSSRTRAIEVIENAGVKVDGVIVQKPGRKFDESCTIEIIKKEIPWVSRGAFKLLKAIDYWKIGIKNKNAIDIGASTGGFTQVLLSKEINKVYCIDVGHGQLHDKIRANPKVINFEKTHIKKLNSLKIRDKISLIVVDVSFISLTNVIPHIADFIKESCEIILLIKPQFEAGPENINKHGLIKDKNLHFSLITKIKNCLELHQMEWNGYIESPIKGGDGNMEFLCYSRKNYRNKI